MTPKQALEVLDAAKPANVPSAVNAQISWPASIEIVRLGINSPRACSRDPKHEQLDAEYVRRVHQVAQNKKEPKYVP